MRGTDETVRIGAAGAYAALVIGAGTFLLVMVVRWSWAGIAAAAVLFAAQLAVLRRAATVLTPRTLTGGLLRRREVPWGEVRALRVSAHVGRVDAVLADGTALPLPGVGWEAPRPAGQAPPRSAQRVAEWARAHGHDLALDRR